MKKDAFVKNAVPEKYVSKQTRHPRTSEEKPKHRQAGPYGYFSQTFTKYTVVITNLTIKLFNLSVKVSVAEKITLTK